MKKNKKETQFIDESQGLNEKKQLEKVRANEKVIDFGNRNVKDLIAVNIDRSAEDYLRVGDKYVRSFMVNGYPSTVHIGWLDELYKSDTDIDTVVHLLPCDNKTALNALTLKITQFQAQLDLEAKKGNTRNITLYNDMIAQLMEQRRGIEQNYTNLFYIQIGANLYTNDKNTLDKETAILTNNLKGRRISLDPMYLQQEEAYKTCMPIGKTFISDRFRNFDSQALAACFPFTLSDLSHKNGTFVAINYYTGAPIFIDFYDRKLLNNSNVDVFGASGSGKTFALSLMILRGALQGIRSAIVDPEGQFDKIANVLGCKSFKISPEAKIGINPFDIEEEAILDSEGRPILSSNGKIQYVVDINSKVADNLNLIGVMAQGMSMETRAVVAHVMQQMYKDFGFTENPRSLYEYNTFDEQTGTLGAKRKKKMPTLSDFRAALVTYCKTSAETVNKNDLNSLINTLSMFCSTGIYGLFDRQTSPELQNFLNTSVINFDVSQLEENILRPIGMYVAMSWIWEKFVKKNPDIKKRVVCDEAWMLTDPKMAGHEFTAGFLEKCARRIRKRNGGLVVASQRFAEFAGCPEGQAVLSNSAVNMFLKQEATDIDDIQNIFKLSDGERQFVATATKGQVLIRANGESTAGVISAFNFEKDFIDNNKKAVSE